MNSIVVKAFSSELSKVAKAGALRRAGKWLKDSAKWGYHGGDPKHDTGRWAKWLNRGGTALTLGVTAGEAMPKEDPLGRGRSRAERATTGLAEAAGGLIGSGALLRTRFGKKHNIIANIAGGAAGGMAARGLAGLPFKKKAPVSAPDQES